ncbi:3'(2'),5'-bisphosphate nucleotidase CysQ [Pontibacter sp. JAM-7]|uniref:3'(2'),5'-bisphosphate nucleotidase CysQ n=1 Tax=Pontibacter sp. JAM-7 TaxID=3366581 RepID=UPI003AF8EF93
MIDHATLIEPLLEICQQAAKAILAVYRQPDFAVQTKSDHSPVTAADLQAHQIIHQGLLRLTPEIPQLSEEAADIPASERQQWPLFWCIDPLDGTKEFIQRNGEFTINIALIENNAPVLGVIYIPMSDTAFWGSRQLGAFKHEPGRETAHIRSRLLSDKLIVAESRRHGQTANAALLKPVQQQFRHIDSLHAGSALKFCLLAEGKADIYPRLFPTSEWDTAAGQALLEAAGGSLVNADTLQPLSYNQRNTLQNPSFFAVADPLFPLELLQQTHHSSAAQD